MNVCNEKNKERVLVTGGTGFIGRRTVGQMSKKTDIDIFVLTRKLHKNTQNVHYLQGDISDKACVASIIKEIKPRRLLHLAWDVSDKGYAGSIGNMDWKRWSIFLLQTFLENGGRYVVTGGTCFEYDLAGTKILTEAGLCRPSTLYGQCKLETYGEFSKLCCQYGARQVWGRIFYPYGEDENSRKLFRGVINCLLMGEKFVCKTPNDVVDYIYVEDVAKMLAFLVINDVTDGIYNLCSGHGVQIEKVLRFIAGKLGREEMLAFQYEHESRCIVGSNQRIVDAGFDINQMLDIGRGLDKYLVESVQPSKLGVM